MNPQEPLPAFTNPETQPIVSNAIPPAPPQKLGKFKASRMLVQESFGVLRQDKELMWFPILSAITNIVVLSAFAAFVFFVLMGGNTSALDENSSAQFDIISYVVVFIYYIITFFITNYFLAGIYTITHARFNGNNLSFKDGIASANKNVGKIFIWSVISATVGLILHIISEKSKIVGRIVAMVFGAAWSILTYFSLPSLIIGERSIKDSFKESAAVIRKTWGETLIANFGIGLFFGIITIAIFVLSIGIIVLIPSTETVIILAILFALYLIGLSIVSSTLGSIIKCALYEYATTGNVPQGFTPDLVKQLIKSK